MTTKNFDICFATTESFEGWHEFSNDKFDPGGATYSGVTQREYNSWRASQKLPPQGVRKMSDDECKTIYKTQYWNAVRGDEVFAGLDLVLYDIAVNSGPITAVKFLQEALRVGVDGAFGLETLGALNNYVAGDALIRLICARRLSFWHSLTTFWRFGRGWTARGEGIETKALALYKEPL